MKSAFESVGYSYVREELIESARAILEGWVVFVSLQGKSIVVVSPLKALMLDQVQIFIEKSVKATYVGTDDCDGGSTADQMENSIGV